MTGLPEADSGRSTAGGSTAGAAVILSANPIHDTGGGQRSAQLALELLDRGYAVLFVSHGRVTETVDLGIAYDYPGLTNVSLSELSDPSVSASLDEHLATPGALVITQVPVREWQPVLERARRAGAATVYDCIDRWDSELGRGWYRPEAERQIARDADVLAASARELVYHVEELAEREVALVPNAYNSRVFQVGSAPPRPADLPEGGPLALYVGALWGSWLDWKLVDQAARALPGTTFVFVGDRRREGRGLPSNCVFLGLKKQTDLPGYLAHCDFAFLPWHADDVTQATSPLKVYEFVAMGLPVLGPDIETLRGIPGVTRFTDGDDFVAKAAETSRGALSDETRSAMSDFAAASSWVQRVDHLLELAGSAVADRVGDAPTPGRPWGRARRLSRPMLSVVIPSYNHERWIGAAVGSVAAQTLPAGELVVIDDGSSDRSIEVVEERAFPRLRLVRQENRGAHAAINRGIALSRGDYIAILNSDDVLEPERLEHAWCVARTKAAGLVIGSVSLIDADGKPLPEDHDSSRWYREARAEPGRAGSLRQALLRHNFAVTTSNYFVHKELWRQLGGFRAYRYAHDLDFVLRALELCEPAVVYAEELEDVRYRVHGDNTIFEDTGRALDERSRIVKRDRSPVRRVLAHLRRQPIHGRPCTFEAPDPFPIDVTDPLPVDDTEDAGAVSAASVTREPLKVGLVVTTLDQGGLEEVVALLAESLPDHGVEARVLCTHVAGMVSERLRAAGVDVMYANRRDGDWRKWMEESTPRVLSTHFASADVIEVLSEWGVPIFETVHNTYAWFTEEDWAREKEKVARLAGTIAVSDLVARYHARHTGTEVTPYVIPNGAHPARAASVPRSWARRHLGIPAEVPVLAHLGRMTLQKNFVGLLDAFAKVLEQRPDAQLIQAGSFGDDSYVKRVRKLHRNLLASGSVHLLPPVRHVGTVLSAADLYASDSFFEGWSVAASEASWNGLPLVLSDCGSARQLVGDGGERGRLVPNPLGDPLEVDWDRLRKLPAHPELANENALVDAILEVLDARDEWVRRRPDIIGHARSTMHPSRVARSYAELFRRAVTP